MNTFKTSILAAAVGLAFSTGAIAMSKDEHKSAKSRIEAEYKTEKAACDSQSDNARDICRAQAKGKENVAKAELESGYKPSHKHTYDVRIAKAEAVYSVSKERCDDVSGNAKDVCVKEARAAETTAKADAKVWLKTADANTDAKQTTNEARAKATHKTADARSDAVADKRAAELKLANAKCDTLAGVDKDNCKTDAKSRYGKI